MTKYVVDGTLEPLATGQTMEQGAYEAVMAFDQYLAHKRLHVDVWDGESLLQVRPQGGAGAGAGCMWTCGTGSHCCR